MSDTAEPAASKHRVVGKPWQRGVSGNPHGRPLGSKNRLADQFVVDLANAWQTHGVQALETVARDDPATLIKVIAQLLPRDLNLNLTGTLDVSTFTTAFRDAVALIHAEPLKIIEHKNGSNRG